MSILSSRQLFPPALESESCSKTSSIVLPNSVYYLNQVGKLFSGMSARERLYGEYLGIGDCIEVVRTLNGRREVFVIKKKDAPFDI